MTGPVATDAPAPLIDLMRQVPRWLVLTGAGMSTASGIPDYRDADGAWKRQQPMTGQAFRASPARRQRYWAGSFSGWPRVAAAEPNAAHRALAALEAAGRVTGVVTQNVDRLHQRAGSTRVVDLHGRLDRLICLDCGGRFSRAAFQRRLAAANPGLLTSEAEAAPDGDSPVAAALSQRFRVPDCRRCGGVLKPDVVFFGENVPRRRVARVRRLLADADGLLVVGSSLMIWSGLRFVRAARAAGQPLAAVNLGRTRADELFDLRLTADCTAALPAVAAAL